ncbi:MAG TPA: M48 family metallopeptidase [Vicinamibacterales bacterium]|nr:M48 family metallopeptidase [Vicinamibacterales bacterium]
MMRTLFTRSRAAALLVLAATTLAGAQTSIAPPSNNYTPAQDVELGRKAAAEARQQLPILRDDAVSSYVDDIGKRLVAAIPPDLRHPEFRYTFEPVNVREINAFALPGGPMFVNRGMIEAAHTEGEIAGVMAHELSHVALRHGTAQASKATKYEIGQAAGAVLGAIIGGGWGQVISQGTQFGLGTAFLRFSREYEKQADLLGAHIMARAGYDPRDMANMFRTIEKESGPGGPQWLSGHPNPGNRVEYITEEAQALRVTNPVSDTRAFQQIQAHLRQLPKAPTTEEATRASTRRTGGAGGTAGRVPTGRVEPPASSFRTYEEGNLFRVSVPANWRELQGSTSSVTFAPEGAYGQSNGQNVFTHGVEFGVGRNETHDLQTATEELLDSLARGNPNLSRPSRFERVNLGDRRGLRALLTNRSDATGGDEAIQVLTTQLRDGNLFYAIGVAPRDEFSSYRGTFDRIASSLQFTDR